MTIDARAAGPSYREAVTTTWAEARIWDYLRYDAAGDLWLNGLRVLDAARRLGTPLEIADTTLVTRRCQEWMALANTAARAAGYPGRLRFLYASKANMASEVVCAAYRAGWDAETSSVQDLHHLRWLKERHLLPPGLAVVCNGFKLPTERFGLPRPEAPVASLVALPDSPPRGGRSPASYVDEILALARHGWHITPILDAEELPSFLGPGTPALSLGLRLKFGRVSTEAELGAWVSRFGLTAAELRESALAIRATDHLRLTSLHAMVGAAEEIPVPRLLAGIGLAARHWCALRREFPTLRELNMGGGLPPLGDPYPHREFLDGLFAELLATAAEAGLPPPDFTFELGSLVAAEAGCHVFKVVQEKRNHVDQSGGPEDWAILDGGLMAAIPDMLLLGKAFRCLAVTGANRPPRKVLLGDLTCDSDGRYPPKAFGPDATVLLPSPGGEQYVLIQGVGAYQEILSGVRGAHHCGLLEAVELVLEPGADGLVRGRVLPRQTPAEAAVLLGYHDDTVPALAEALAAARGEAG